MSHLETKKPRTTTWWKWP